MNERWKVESCFAPTATPAEVFKVGCSFEHAAHVVTRSIVETAGGSLTACTNLGDEPLGVVPMVVSMSFSAELYLKCLIWLETGNRVMGHRLEDFCKSTTPESQDAIRRHYERFIEPSKTKFKASLTAVVANDCMEFEQALKVASDGFAQWRYVYERSPTVGMNLILFIAAAIRERIIELQPKWKAHVSSLATLTTSQSR